MGGRGYNNPTTTGAPFDDEQAFSFPDLISEEEVSRVEIILGKQRINGLRVRVANSVPSSEEAPFLEGILIYQSDGPFNEGQKIIAKGGRPKQNDKKNNHPVRRK